VCSAPLVDGAQVCEDGEDPAVVVGAFGEIELEENVVYITGGAPVPERLIRRHMQRGVTLAGYCDRADATGDAFRKGSYDPIVEACLPLAGK
jgi:hypothetical protein